MCGLIALGLTPLNKIELKRDWTGLVDCQQLTWIRLDFTGESLLKVSEIRLKSM